jgi:hypothetical protein
MDRYDWEWARRFGGRGGSRYERDPRYGGIRPGGAYGGAPWGDYRSGGARGRARGYGGYGGYDRWRGPWQGEEGPGYRYSYGGGGGGRGRQEPWEPGPPGGYGQQWGMAYGDGPQGARWGYDTFRGGGEPFPRNSERFDAFAREAYADLPDPPRGYYDEYDPELDDEPIGSGGTWRGGGWNEEPDDGEVRDSVTRTLREDGFIDADAIQVEVKDRVVTLRGEVQDYMEARYAWDDAWDAPGVRGVISKLTVQGVERGEGPTGSGKLKGTGVKRGQGSAGSGSG